MGSEHEADAQVGEIVQSTSYQGFPVIRSEEDRTVTGFVRKAELRYALGQLSDRDMHGQADAIRQGSPNSKLGNSCNVHLPMYLG